MRGGARGGDDDGRAPPPAERRAWPRRTALDPRGWIGWWADGEFFEDAGRLLDISRGGAAVEVDRTPPPDCPVYFCLDGPDAPEGVEAEVVATLPGRRRKYLVRLTFAAPCPNPLWAAAVLGPGPALPAGGPIAPTDRGRHQG
jgi:hypothetical protein